MRFPALAALALPCRFNRWQPGVRTADGRLVLPTIVFDLPAGAGIRQIGVVDRHHLVERPAPDTKGIARLVFLLGQFRVQAGTHRHGFDDADSPHYSTAPAAFGQVTQVLSWDVQRGNLPYESLYTELVLDIGVGTIGVRTHATAPSLVAQIGRDPVSTGDWLALSPSRIDILAFVPDNPGG